MTTKVYCERCNEVFSSQEKYRKHLDTVHSGMSCDTCIIDLAINKIIGLFKRDSIK